MRTAVTPIPRDPDFDHPARAEHRPSADVARYYQRLVVNPFLAVITGCATCAAAMLARSVGIYWVLPTVTIGVILAFTFLQYHCLDCGATGMYRRWRQHACPHVCDRWRYPFSYRMLLFPSPSTQLVLWFFLFLLALMMAGTWL